MEQRDVAGDPERDAGESASSDQLEGVGALWFQVVVGNVEVLPGVPQLDGLIQVGRAKPLGEVERCGGPVAVWNNTSVGIILTEIMLIVMLIIATVWAQTRKTDFV